MRKSQINASFRLALIYLASSIGWILLSDTVVHGITKDPERIKEMQNMKGILWVTLSSILLYFISVRMYRTLNKSLASREAILKKLNALNTATGEGIIDYDLQNDTARLNDQMKAFMGIDRSVVSNFREVHNAKIHPSDLGRLQALFVEFTKGNQPTWQTEYRYKTPDGEYRDILSRGILIRNKSSNKPSHMIFAMQDITDLRDANSRYYEQQMNFRQSLTKSIIEAQEKERNRWAEELHDNIGQSLTVSKLFLDQVAEETPGNAYVEKAREMVGSALTDIRQISSTLKPPKFGTTTLQEALNDLVNNINRFNEMRFEIHIDEETETLLNDEQKLMAYRIIQEQVNNILKYAGATLIEIRLEVTDLQAFIYVIDNGIGFNPDEVKTGIGLKNIRSRLQVFSGNLTINTQPNQGCELQAVFSLV